MKATNVYQGETNQNFNDHTQDSTLNNIDANNEQLRGSSDFVLVSTKENGPPICQRIKCWIRKKYQKTCSKATLCRRVPILDWLPKYNWTCAIGDLVAGITVGLTIIPQALAYSNIAGLPHEYGLYSSFLGCFIYIIFGSCKDAAMGPSSISALVTFQAVKNKGPKHAILLCFLTGVIQLVMGFFGLGFLVNFISGPVASGFTSAVALIIVASQIKDLLGIKASGDTFVQEVASIISDINDTHMWDVLLGMSCIVILMLLRVTANVKFGPSSKEVPLNKFYVSLNCMFWLIGISRNAILVVASGLIGYHVFHHGDTPFKIVGYVPQGLPTFTLPPFSTSEIINGTAKTEHFIDMISDLGSGLLIVPVLGLMEDISVCKAFANGKTVDATQELIAIGFSNTANSFFQAFPGTGSLSRSAVNNGSGVKTTLGGVYTGVIVMASLLFLTPYFFYIPKAALAAIIICAAIFMVEIKTIKPMWRAKKTNLIPAIVTFIACLVFRLEYGLVIGLGTDLLFILYHAARPKISVEKVTSPRGTDYLLLTPDRCLIFPSVDYVRKLVNKYSMRQRIPVVIDCSHIYGADYTAATVIDILTQDFSGRQQPLLFYNLKPSVSSVFDGISPKDFMLYYNREQIDEMLNRWHLNRKL